MIKIKVARYQGLWLVSSLESMGRLSGSTTKISVDNVDESVLEVVVADASPTNRRFFHAAVAMEIVANSKTESMSLLVGYVGGTFRGSLRGWSTSSLLALQLKTSRDGGDVCSIFERIGGSHFLSSKDQDNRR